jgi:hypothetical protein
MNFAVFSVTFIMILSVFSGSLYAKPEYGVETGKSCLFCHFSPSGGGELNGQGMNYQTKRLNSSANGGVIDVEAPEQTKRGGDAFLNKNIEAEESATEVDRARRMTEIERSAMVLRQLKARATYRNAILKGRKLFHEPGILGAGIQSCKDCHKASDLSDLVTTYPKWDEDLSEVITFDRKLRHCIYVKMKGKPLSAETPVTVALTVYLNEVKKGSVK